MKKKLPYDLRYLEFFVAFRSKVGKKTNFVPISPLLQSKGEALRIIIKDISQFLIDQKYDEKALVQKLKKSFSKENSIDMKEFGLDYIYQIVKVDSKENLYLSAERYFRYYMWLASFKKELNIPKVGLYNPEEFCMGVLTSINNEEPNIHMRFMGFYKYVFPINWKEFFTTGHTVFHDWSNAPIEFDFTLSTKRTWKATLKVKMEAEEVSTEIIFKMENDWSTIKKFDKVSYALGLHFMEMLCAIHPVMNFEDEEYDYKL